MCRCVVVKDVRPAVVGVSCPALGGHEVGRPVFLFSLSEQSCQAKWQCWYWSQQRAFSLKVCYITHYLYVMLCYLFLLVSQGFRVWLVLDQRFGV